jgi:DNA-binding GntR family transcriptional regulator
MPESTFAPLNGQPTRSDQVRDALRRALLSGAFAPGEQLNEGNLAAQLGVSKTPVREALSMLRATGLVVSKPPRGLAVAVIGAGRIREIYELREILESEAVRRAVPNVDDQLVAHAQAILTRAQQLGEQRELPGLIQLNRDFHELLYDRCGNDEIKRVLNGMRDQVEFAVAGGWMVTPSWEMERTEHAAILDAVTKRDARLAAKLTRKHIESARARLIYAGHGRDTLRPPDVNSGPGPSPLIS